MKIFLILSIMLAMFAAWAADYIARLLESDPVLVLIAALTLLALVVCYVLLRPRDEPQSDARDPRAWMNHPHARQQQTRGAAERGGTTAKRLHTDGRGETWWEVTNPDGRVTLEHENYDDIIAAAEERLRKL